MWLLPRWMGIHADLHAPQAEPLRWIGLLPFVGGSIVMLTCVWRFGTTGEGTPLPLDPPQKFVAVGPYRYVRNPMYLGMAFALIGEAILFAEPRKPGTDHLVGNRAGGDHELPGLLL
jgi:protein-S-isoprenylcysteine O-methyltransferase Ste14